LTVKRSRISTSIAADISSEPRFLHNLFTNKELHTVKIEFRVEPIPQLSTPALVAYTFEDAPASSGSVERLPEETRKQLAELQASGELAGKPFEFTLLRRPSGTAAARLLIIGAGKREKFSAAVLRQLAGAGARHLRSRGAKEMAWVLGSTDSSSVAAVVEGVLVADYDADRYRSERSVEKRIDSLSLATAGGAFPADAQVGIDRGRILGEAQNFTRDLVNEPSNVLTPVKLAERATEMANRFGLESEVLGPEDIQRLKMGAFWGVAQGSQTEPARLIVLRYAPAGAPETPVIGLIGKGITFDSGGISIKPAENMHEMKTDMAGGATMLGVMQAIAQLKPNVRVTALIPATENMPSGNAFKPGDVLTSMSGKTIEILNTDAEGRLILADALTYAKRLGCTVLIDAATLTGACMVALGNITTGVFGWNKEWVNRVLAAAGAAGEKMWELPVDDDYRDLYKSPIADLANTGGRYGGAITAAMFIGEFAGDTPWVHLDIAGTRWSNEEKPYRAKGPTGHGVRTLVQLLTDYKQ
jgi:leucyl aminopeptidase